MSPSAVITIVSIFVLMDVVLVWGIRQWVKTTFEEIARDFPPREPLPGAVKRRWQSISVDMFNFGWSVNIAADEWGLHFEPIGLGRVFAARAFSVPFDAIKLKDGRRGRWLRKARMGKWDLTAPAWALGLAEGESTAP